MSIYRWWCYRWRFKKEYRKNRNKERVLTEIREIEKENRKDRDKKRVVTEIRETEKGWDTKGKDRLIRGERLERQRKGGIHRERIDW